MDEIELPPTPAPPPAAEPSPAEIGPISLTSPPREAGPDSRSGECSEFDAATWVGDDVIPDRPPDDLATTGPYEPSGPPSRATARPDPPPETAPVPPAGWGFSDELVHAVRRQIGHEGLLLLSLLKQATGYYDGVLRHPPDHGMTDYVPGQRAVAAAQRDIELAAVELGLPPEPVLRHWRELIDICRVIPPDNALRRVPPAAALWQVPQFTIRCLPGQPQPRTEMDFFRQVQLEEKLSDSPTAVSRTDGSFENYALVVGKLVLWLSLRCPQAVISVEHCSDSLWEALMRPESG